MILTESQVTVWTLATGYTGYRGVEWGHMSGYNQLARVTIRAQDTALQCKAVLVELMPI